MESEATRLVVIDGSNMFWRAYHGLIKQRFSQDGQDTWGVYGSINSVVQTVRRLKPTHLIIIFDVGKSEFRLNIWSKYKAGRPQTDVVDYDEAHTQQGILADILPLFGVVVWREAGVEADDIIATVVNRFQYNLDEVIVVSGDKDMKQLIAKNVTLYQPSLGQKLEKTWTEEDINLEYGVPVYQLPEVWALCGDKVDNIPGVPGIGEKTAIKLIQQYGDLSQVVLSDEKKLQGYRHDIMMSHQLVQLYPELSTFELSLDDVAFKPTLVSDSAAKNLEDRLTELGFATLSSRFNQGTLWQERGVRLRDLRNK